MKILLVEDHATVADMSCRLLREVYDHDVRLASCGREAFERLEQFTPDMALIDLNLPDMNGYELAHRLRSDPRHDGVVLVALTGWGNLVDEPLATMSGFDAHFTKPMDFEMLPLIRRRTAG